ncbi:MAG: glycogen debranching enzyme [Betaproteobacteria bacterium RIFCSPLOWO2_12_FULL_68_19]|nr:MAG: glycogen debranching enzyme [Betaproteobacteria bacterium RIFCSPLOWO2_12_FULL_68_19]
MRIESNALWAAAEGLPFPLGATWIEEERAFNFALYSKHAESVELLLYAPGDIVNPVLVYSFDYLRNKSGRVWHCRIPLEAMKGAAYYAYRVDGPLPAGRFEWHAFDRDKVLLDPYAKSVFFPPSLDRLAAARPGSNAGKAPLGVIAGDHGRSGREGPRRAAHEAGAVIYELHVGGFTRHPSSAVRREARGTYAGVIEKIPYLKELGVTVVELMPVFQFDPSDGNYWGYAPLNFFAPHNGYLARRAAESQHDEFRDMVDALHAADIEVVLDVVYNHTGEGDHTGPTYSFKGVDNSTYYMIADRPGRPYEDFSGTGNTLNCANRAVRKMIMDSVRHWAHDMGVDGFRFDLASIFTRGAGGTINLAEAPLLSDMASDPGLAGLRLIAEPWDAAGAYQLGRAFPGITACQWNGRFRDDVRRFVRGDPGMVPLLMRRLYGSDDLFPDDRMNAYRPHQSVNYIASHDGFTLYDLVAYNAKRNWANGHRNTDGADENFSWNCGWEGDEGAPPQVARLRKQQVKNYCCLLFLSNGTPMFRAGDEFTQTQAGNNNPYNQDNETAWLDWRRLDDNADVLRFFRLMIAFRRAHPSLARSRFWREDVRWYGVGREADLSYDSRSLAFALHGASQRDDDLYVMINAYWEDLDFQVQEGTTAEWRRVVDTSLDSPLDFLEPGGENPLQSLRYRVAARSVAVLLRERTA